MVAQLWEYCKNHIVITNKRETTELCTSKINVCELQETFNFWTSPLEALGELTESEPKDVVKASNRRKKQTKYNQRH